MADPLSTTGLAIQAGALMRQLYDYGKSVKGAQKQIIVLCSELAALKSILADLQSQNDSGTISLAQQDHADMLSMAHALMSDLSKRLRVKSSSFQRALQSLKFPLDEDTRRDALAKLERLKSWFMLALMSEEQSTSKAMQNDLDVLRELIRSDITERKQHKDEQDDRRLRAFLAPVSPDNVHRKACESWKDTPPSSWFIDGPVSEWISSTDRVMILIGKSGAGKTTLISQAIEKTKEYAEANPGLRIGYFYCSYNDIESQEVRNVLGSWMVQVAAGQTSLMPRIPERGEDDKGTASDIIEQALCEVKAKVLLLVDAVNESFETEKLLQCIARITKCAPNVKCLLSTTALSQKNTLKHRRIEMETELATPAMEGYIRWKRAQHHVLQDVPEVEFLRVLIPRADGMFRWVDVQMSILADQLTPKRVRKALEHLPGNLNETYATILSRISKPDEVFVREVLLWLSFSYRPLKLHELCEAVVVEDGDSTIDDSCRIEPRHRLIELCRGLVVWDSITDVVSLAHSSVRTYLMGKDIRSGQCANYGLDEQSSDRRISWKCLTYMSMRDFNLPYCNILEVRQLQRKFPLLDYASKTWAVHARKVQDHLVPEELGLMNAFLLTHRSDDYASSFMFWINCLIPRGQRNDHTQRRAAILYGFLWNGRLHREHVSSKPDQQGTKRRPLVYRQEVWQSHFNCTSGGLCSRDPENRRDAIKRRSRSKLDESRWLLVFLVGSAIWTHRYHETIEGIRRGSHWKICKVVGHLMEEWEPMSTYLEGQEPSLHNSTS